jgi:hypothetical protein
LAGSNDQEVRFVDDGWVWRHGDYVAILPQPEVAGQ